MVEPFVQEVAALEVLALVLDLSVEHSLLDAVVVSVHLADVARVDLG